MTEKLAELFDQNPPPAGVRERRTQRRTLQ
jgi:hypothetical protein